MTAALPVRRRLLEAAPGPVLAVFAAMAVLVPVLSQRGMVAALALAGLVSFSLHVKARRAVWPTVRNSMPLRAAALYVAWSALSVGWALAPDLAAHQAAQLAGGLLCLALLLAVTAELAVAERRLIGMGVVAGVLLGTAMLALDGFTGMPLQHLLHSRPGTLPGHFLNKGLVTVVLLAWPAALHLWQLGRRACAALLLSVVSVAVFPQDSSTAALALGCGIVAAVLTRLGGRAALWLIGLALIGGTVAMPLVVKPLRIWFWEHLDLMSWWSAHHRLHIWSFVVERIADKPWLGWGLEASRAMPDFGWPSWQGHDRVIPTHPHNNILQTWMELGAVGVALLVGAMLIPLRRALTLSWGQRIFAAGAWAATVAAAVPGYGAGQSWWLFTVLAQAVLFRAVLIPEEDR